MRPRANRRLSVLCYWPVWATAACSPNLFAALVPVCGGFCPLLPRGTKLSSLQQWANSSDFPHLSKLTYIPTWIFHAGKDSTVNPGGSTTTHEELRSRGTREQQELHHLKPFTATVTRSGPQFTETLSCLHGSSTSVRDALERHTATECERVRLPRKNAKKLRLWGPCHGCAHIIPRAADRDHLRLIKCHGRSSRPSTWLSSFCP